MKKYEISLEQMEQLLKLIRLEQYLTAKLSAYHRYQKLQLEMFNEIKGTAKRLNDFKDYKPFWDNVDSDLKKIITKYGRL
jgi:hypothetical protein